MKHLVWHEMCIFSFRSIGNFKGTRRYANISSRVIQVVIPRQEAVNIFTSDFVIGHWTWVKPNHLCNSLQVWNYTCTGASHTYTVFLPNDDFARLHNIAIHEDSCDRYISCIYYRTVDLKLRLRWGERLGKADTLCKFAPLFNLKLYWTDCRVKK